MYCFVSKIAKNKITGTLAGVLYMLMPYHLNDMYIRNALGEFLSYIFIPLVFLGIYKLFQKEKGEWILSIGAVRINTYTYFNDIYDSNNGSNICINKYIKIKRQRNPKKISN